MAQIIITRIIDGPRNAVFHAFIEGDGTGELAGEILIDPATDVEPALENEPTLTVERLEYSLVGFDAKIAFEYLASDTPVWALAGGQESKADFCKFAGIRDRSGTLDGSGKLKITTSGLGDGDFGSIIVYVRKN